MTILLRRRKLGNTSCREIAANSEKGIVVVRNDKPMPKGHELVIRWGTTSNLPYGANVLNTSEAIHWVNDKAVSRKIMADAGLSPKTSLDLPSYGFGDNDDVNVIVRRRTHSQGKHLYHCTNDDELFYAIRKLGEGNYYISNYIPKVAEYRVLVGCGRVVWVAKKTPANPDAIAWNVAKGGRFDNVRWKEWPMEAIRVSIEAFKLSGLDFGGVDVMVDKDGRAYVLEINSAPSQTSPYRQLCMSKFFDYVIERGKEHIPVADYKSYLGVVHPAIAEGARFENG